MRQKVHEHLEYLLRISPGLLAFLLVGLVFPIGAASVPSARSFFVSPSGNDSAGDGSIGNPWRTVAAARDHIRTAGLNTNMQADIVINLRGGRYPLTQTLAFTDADSGDNGYYITYQSYSNEVATISGGVQVTNWSPVAGEPYWVASVPTNAFGDYFRQLYVNGIRAERAHSDWITGVSFFNDPATSQSVDGVAFNAGDLKDYSNVTDLRLLHIEEFKVDEFPVTGITTNDNNGLIQVSLQQPYCQIRHDRTARYFAETNQWMLVQAFEELDEPGEWYLNRATHEVYYYPYSFEDMTKAEVYAPVVETLVSFNGDSTTNKVQNLRFQNMVFEHGNWLFPGKYFIGGSQAEILMPGMPPDSKPGSEYAYEMPGQIVLNNTKGLQFIGNTIQHMGSCGIQLYNGTRDTLIQGNIFFDLTGAAVLGGHWGETAIPNEEICTNTIVANNVIRAIGMDFMAATAIDNLGHYGFQVRHNDVADSQYMGIHQRIYAPNLKAAAGQGGSVISFNRVSLANVGQRYGVSDGAYIYSHGIWPNSVIQGNDINDLNCPMKDTFGMYFDNNSYGLTAISNVMRNVQPGRIGYNFVRALTNNVNFSIENYGDATKNLFAAVSNVNFHKFTGKLPAVARRIVDNAGLESGYTNLLSSIYAGTNLARGKFAWASGQYNSHTSPAAAVDWDYNTIWAPESGSMHGWWAVDLGAPYVIQRVEIAPRTDLNQPSARCDFQVQGANNSEFTNAVVLAEQGSVPFAYKDEPTYKGTRLTSSWIKYINYSQGFRYLRVIKTASGTLNFSEFQAYGYRATGNNPEVPPKSRQVVETKDVRAGVKIVRAVDYLAPGRAEKADLYFPPATATGSLRAAVLIIHGGGWTIGRRDDERQQNIGTTLASHGYVAMSIDYVLASKTNATWPQNLYDCKTAVRWLRKNAARLQIDPNRIGVIGGSAGGQLAAMVTLNTTDDQLDPPGPYGEYSCRVICGVDLYGPAELLTWRDLVMIGKTRAEAPEIYRIASPINYVRSNSPPLLIIHGTGDKTVPVKQSELFAAALQKAGATHELIIVPGAPHSFDLQPSQRDLRPAVLGFFDKYLGIQK
jgi:acetyl esterase/lipase